MKRAREESGLPDVDHQTRSLSEPPADTQPEQSYMNTEVQAAEPAKPQQAEAPDLDLTVRSSDSSADELAGASSQAELDESLQLHQVQLQLVMELDSHTAPCKRMQLLAGHLPYPQHYQTWLEEQHNPNVCGIRLIGDAQQPHEYVGVGVLEMVAHSPWAAARIHQTHMQTSGLDTIVPICSPLAAVKKLVAALYTGFITLQDDVEEILNLANCMQVKLVEDACIRYLLNLQLPAQQLSQMMHLCGRLMLYETRKQLLQMYAHVPWAADNLSILPVLFETLLEGGSREIELCKEVLFSADCGALCELQVYDMLCAAGLSQQDPLLASLFRVERVCDQGMDQFNQVVDLDPAHGASRELLAGMAARQRWEHAPQGYRAQRRSLTREKVMMGQLQLVRGTEFRRFPDDSSQLFVPPCLGECESHVDHICISSKASPLDFGQNVDQLITYAVRSNPSEPLIEVLDMFHLTNRCQQVVCEATGKSVAFVRQVIQGLNRDQYASRERPCFGIWVHKLCIPPTPNAPN